MAILRDLRLKAGMTQAELSERLGRPQSFVSKVERGERRIDLVELRELCEQVGSNVSTVVSRGEHDLR